MDILKQASAETNTKLLYKHVTTLIWLERANFQQKYS